MNSRSADVVVVGGGIIGASIAWRVAQAGLRVAILEGGAFGKEASWAGAGMLAPGGEVEHRSPLADFALESLALYPGFIGDLQAESRFDIDYQSRGAVDVAYTSDEWEMLETRAAAQRELGIASEPLAAAPLGELQAALGRNLTGALRFPADSAVDPRHVMQALQIACGKRNVEIRENHRVTAIYIRERHIECDSPRGMFTATRVVVAAGAWSGEIPVFREGAQLPLPVSFPVKGHLLGYRLDPGSLATILRHCSTYILQRADGFTVAGSSVERIGFDRAIDPGMVAGIHERACDLLPRLRQAPRPEPWIGFRPATENHEPQLHRISGTGLWLAYGHYRNGILLAPATARRISREIIASWERDSTSRAGSH
jgi:glycine oxidase